MISSRSFHFVMEKKHTSLYENLIPYGEREERIVSVEDLDEKIEYGKRCNCICPRCKAPLLAKIRKGQQGKRRKHFAHDGTSDCRGAYESALHMLVKEVIEEGAKIKLPPIVSSFSGSGYFVHNDTVLFSAIYSASTEIEPDEGKTEVEKNLGSFRPDVIVESGGHQLIIEVLVSHAVDEEKTRQINEHGVSCVEVDFSFYRDAVIDKKSIRKALEGNDENVSINWLYSNKKNKYDTILKSLFPNLWLITSPTREFKSGEHITSLGTKHRLSEETAVDECSLKSRSEIQTKQLRLIGERLYGELYSNLKESSCSQPQQYQNADFSDKPVKVFNQVALSTCMSCKWNNGFLRKLDSEESGYALCSKNVADNKAEEKASCSLVIEFARTCIVPQSREDCKEFVSAFIQYLGVEQSDEIKDSTDKAIEVLLERFDETKAKEIEQLRSKSEENARRRQLVDKQQREEWFQDRANLFSFFEDELQKNPVSGDVSDEDWTKKAWETLSNKVPAYFIKKYTSLYVRLWFKNYVDKCLRENRTD